MAQLEKHHQVGIVGLFNKELLFRIKILVSIQMQIGFRPIVSTVMDGWIVLAMDSVLCLGTLSVNTIEIHCIYTYFTDLIYNYYKELYKSFYRDFKMTRRTHNLIS
jgi:hypothetical protein